MLIPAMLKSRPFAGHCVLHQWRPRKKSLRNPAKIPKPSCSKRSFYFRQLIRSQKRPRQAVSSVMVGPRRPRTCANRAPGCSKSAKDGLRFATSKILNFWSTSLVPKFDGEDLSSQLLKTIVCSSTQGQSVRTVLCLLCFLLFFGSVKS